MKKTLLALALFTIALVGCRKTVDFRNGEIPAEYLEQAKDAFEGTYTGKFENEHLGIVVKFNKNKPTLLVSRDLLGSDCQSEIGHIASADVEKNDDQVKVHSAAFHLNGGNCQVKGEYVNIRPFIKNDGKRALGITILWNSRRECKIEGDHYVCERIEWHLKGEVTEVEE